MYAATLIPTRFLRPADLPHAEADWPTLAAFASTFDPSERFRSIEACKEACNWAHSQWSSTGRVPHDLDQLRACLYFEARKWRFFRRDPDPAARRYCAALVREMRLRV